MPEIFKFPIHEAYAEPITDGIKVTLIYPDKAKRLYTTERKLSTEADIEFGIRCLEGLLRGDRVRIGTSEHPSRPASGGILDLFTDGSFLTHRRDGGTKVHPWYNGIPSGFPSTDEEFKDISVLQAREGAEESIVFMQGNKIARPVRVNEHIKFMRTGVYKTGNHIEKQVINEKVKQLGLKNNVTTASVEYTGGTDILEIRDAAGNIISKSSGSIYLSWEVETNVAIAVARYWRMYDPQMVKAVDGEGFMKDGKFVHLNREKFHIRRDEVENVAFGQEIPMPKRYKLHRTEEGIGVPESIPAKEGEVYRFMPDDGLRRMLDASNFAGWKGKWIHYEIAEAEKRMRELQQNL